MNQAEKKIINDEIAKTYELFNLEMTFQEYKDIFELGAKFGHSLAKIDINEKEKEVDTFEKQDVTIWQLKKQKEKSHSWFERILR